MTKRIGNLMPQIAELKNIRLAYWKAKRGREAKPEIRAYSKAVDNNILELRNGLLSDSFEIGNYHYFTIHDPKERLICAASFPERVLHHAMMNVCHQHFERFQISDSYATRVGKGQYAALDRANHFNTQYKWFCKLDVRKYFDSICHDVLFTKLKNKFKDKQMLILFKRIIDSYEVLEGKGIPIGNLTSQYFANFYLGFADRFIKEKIGIKGYVRYMDDMVIWSNDRKELITQTNMFIEFIQNELKLDVKPICMNTIDKGLPFLGYVLFRNGIRLNKNSKKRFARKIVDYQSKVLEGDWSQKDFADHAEPLIAFTQHANAKSLRRIMLCDLEAS